ncbi:hypothetical protein TNCV_2656701 [Trichonephila clavipes]|nr:hypothetical protein TNCV_2656701 [Trichonephila clavipes]
MITIPRSFYSSSDGSDSSERYPTYFVTCWEFESLVVARPHNAYYLLRAFGDGPECYANHGQVTWTTPELAPQPETFQRNDGSYWDRTRDQASHDPIPIPLGYRGHDPTGAKEMTVSCVTAHGFKIRGTLPKNSITLSS